jgi:hypothetical protein
VNSLPPPIPPSNYESNFTGPLRYDRQAIASLVCGIIGLLLFGVILGTVALVLGSKARTRISAQPGRLKGSGMALAGMILGAIDLVAFVLLVVV